MARKKGESKTSPRIIKSRERQALALELRKSGATYQQIADQLGYRSPQSAHKSVTSALKKLVEEPSEELRKVELERLDGMFLEMYRQAKQGILGAVDRCLRIMERRAKLLGLDAPQQLAVDWRSEVERMGIPAGELFEEMVAGIMERMSAESKGD